MVAVYDVLERTYPESIDELVNRATRGQSRNRSLLHPSTVTSAEPVVGRLVGDTVVGLPVGEKDAGVEINRQNSSLLNVSRVLVELPSNSSEFWL